MDFKEYVYQAAKIAEAAKTKQDLLRKMEKFNYV